MVRSKHVNRTKQMLDVCVCYTHAIAKRSKVKNLLCLSVVAHEKAAARLQYRNCIM